MGMHMHKEWIKMSHNITVSIGIKIPKIQLEKVIRIGTKNHIYI